jgi:cob(I)alamin adenosyltransferase
MSEQRATELPPVYTKTGDDGSTGLLFGGRVSKADPLVELCGALDEHPLRPAFVVPGNTPASAALDLARTSLRRAERRLVAARQAGVAVSTASMSYLNRSSDLAYVLARRAAGDQAEPLSHQ